MDLNQFLTIPMIAFCLVVSVLVWAQRKGLELAFPKIKEHIVWRDFFLPLGPAATGAILGGVITNYPFPASLTSLAGRIFCGVVCGLASGTVYRILKKFLAEKLGPTAGQPAAGQPTTPATQNADQKDPDDLSQV